MFMKKNYLRLIGSFLVSLLFITGCQKVIQDQPFNSEIESLSKSDHEGGKNECRMTFGTNTDPTYSQDWHFHYNDKGLADEWYIENQGIYKLEYDAGGRLKKSIYAINDEVFFTTYFFYQGRNKKVVKEIVYFGTGTDIFDEIYHTYNGKGKLVKVQSFVNDYVALTKYSHEGSVLSNELFFGGTPVYSAFYTYNKHYKNPYQAIQGIDHAFPYYAPAYLFCSDWQFAGAKEVGYDENGNPFTTFEYDASKTVWQAGHQNYPASATYYDLLSADWYPYKFEFENCGPHNNCNSSITPPSSLSARKINPLTLLQRNPAKSFKEQVKEFRQQLKNIKN
jgi:hypothetical protein